MAALATAATGSAILGGMALAGNGGNSFAGSGTGGTATNNWVRTARRATGEPDRSRD